MDARGDDAGAVGASTRNLHELSEADTRGFLKVFRDLPEERGVVRVFERRECWSVHGDAALLVARRFYRTTSVLRHLGSGPDALPGVTLNRNLYETVLRELLLEGTEHTVELWVEGRQTGWHCARRASPGKLGAFEDELFRTGELADTPVIVAARVVVRDGAPVVGAAYSNPATRELGACEFVDDEQFITLEALLVQLGAKEVVVPAEKAPSAQGRRLRDVISRCGALPTEKPPGEFNPKELERDLSRLLKAPVEQHRAILEREGAAAALAALINFAEHMGDESLHGKFSLSLYDTGKYMRLDAAALRALNVLKEKSDLNDTFSLYGLMNRARTPMGKRLLLRWLKQPLLDVAAIDERLNIVESFVEDSELRDTLRGAQLKQLPDVERLTRKLEKGTTSLMDLCRLYQASCALPIVAQAIEGHDGRHAELLRERFAAPLLKAHDAEHLGKFEALLEAAVDLDKIPEEYVICASYDAELGELQREKDKLDKEIDRAWDDAARDLGLERNKVLKLDHAAHHGHFFRLTKKEETNVRAKLQSKYQIIEAKKDGTKFTNRALKQLSERRQELSRSYDQAQRALVKRVVDVASSFSEVLMKVAAVVAELDVLLGFADLAACAPTPYVRPTMLPKGEGDIVLEGCRHPNVEVQEGVSFIPNDCRLEHGKSWFQIITGPNMGGKSTFIRQVGVSVLMAQVGCFVPCDRATVSVRDAVFARVGAGDCQLRGISTFMAEMLETSSILKSATPASLIIIDELGRGTSTYDGFGLAWAISEHIVQEVKAPCLFATHFHELTALQGVCGVKNFHVEAHIDATSRKLTMLYTLKEGAASQSFGIHCAEFARFPEEVLQVARQKAAELEDFSVPAAPAAADDEPPAEVGAKRKRVSGLDDAARGAARVREFLSAFAALPLPEMDPAVAVEKVREMRAAVERDATENPWLQTLLRT